VSSITLIEVYGCKNLSPEEKEALDTVFARLIVYDLDQEVIDGAIRLRQAHRMRLGDSIIAATALCHGLRLATNNTADFTGIPGLELFNPLRS
jgi:predicted nucleic acid-binding protein